MLVLSTGSCRDSVSVSGQSYSPVFECTRLECKVSFGISTSGIVLGMGISVSGIWGGVSVRSVSLSGGVVWCKKSCL